MKRIYKLIAVAMLVTMAATYADILWHQRDGQYGGEVKHSLPTTRAIVRVIQEYDAK